MNTSVFWSIALTAVLVVARPGMAEIISTSGNIISTTGTIRLDANNDSLSEAIINATGLGVGTTSPSANLHVVGNAVLSNNLGIGTSAPKSTLEVSGTAGFSVQTTSTNATLSGNSIVIADTSSGNITLTLPYAGNVAGRIYFIKKSVASNTLWVEGGGNMIDQSTVAKMITATNSYPFLGVCSDGRQWYATTSSPNLEMGVGLGNLVGYWKFDESSGNTASDSSGRGNSATLGGGMTFASNSTTGKVSQALVFDGVDDHATVTLDLSGTRAVSVAFWVYWNAFSNNDDLMMEFGTPAFSSGNKGFLIDPNSSFISGNFEIAMAEYGNYQNSSFVRPSAAAWHHYVFVFNKANAALTDSIAYVDGVQQSKPLHSSPYNTDMTGTFGKEVLCFMSRSGNSGGALYGQGIMDDVRIFDKALGQEDVDALYQSTR